VLILDNQPFSAPVGKVVCVGRNYAAHARELNNPVPEQPLLFIKPATAVVPLDKPLCLPQGLGEVHHELEIAVLIGQPLTSASAADCTAAIAGIGLALDLTLRDLQQQLKQQGHPWERAKAFDGACPLSPFVSLGEQNLQALNFSLYSNGELRQRGESADMLFSIPSLLAEISTVFTLQPGDVVLTGTPAGVGPLNSGDHLTLVLDGLLKLEARVA
jgi:2-keto-4-pentenoate hydratase/2-oxohepta-3-ene-1,7-dioic acid hydratase in catechol pathway